MYPNLKLRVNYIIYITTNIKNFISDEVIKLPETLDFLIPYFTHDFQTFEYDKKKWTTQEDIDIMDETLDKLISLIINVFEFSEEEVEQIWKKNKQKIQNKKIERIEFHFKQGLITEKNYKKLLTGEISWCTWIKKGD